MQTVNVTIDIHGNVTVDVAGVAGPGCKDLSRQIEKSLGSTVNSRPTPELFKTAQETKGVRR
jgi:hypothetical protein